MQHAALANNTLRRHLLVANLIAADVSLHSVMSVTEFWKAFPPARPTQTLWRAALLVAEHIQARREVEVGDGLRRDLTSREWCLHPGTRLRTDPPRLLVGTAASIASHYNKLQSKRLKSSNCDSQLQYNPFIAICASLKRCHVDCKDTTCHKRID